MPRTPSYRMHPEPRTLKLFFAKELPDAAQAEVERHLRKGCIACILKARELALELTAESRRALSEGLFNPEDGERELERYEIWLQHKVLLIDLEEGLTAALAAELMLRSAAARREAVRKSTRYQTLALAEAFREESRSEGHRDVARAVELAELAVEVADCLDPGFYGTALVSDARALAYAMLGNVQRITGDLFQAERQLRTALDLLHYGTGSPTEEAEVLSLLASLRTDQSRFQESMELLEMAGNRYHRSDLHRLEGKTLVKMAIAADRNGEPDRAVEIFQVAIGLLDEQEDARMIFWTRHNIVASLSNAGHFHDARRYLEEIAPLYRQFEEDRAIQVRRRWAEGLICAGLGELAEAENALLEVRSTFVDLDRAFDIALATLDLAALYLRQGRTDEVKRLAEEMYPIFRSQDVHRQALAALALFKQAALSEAITIGFVHEVTEYLKRSRYNPYLAFEPTKR